MGTAITKSEREALDELFLAMQKKDSFIIKMENSRKKIIFFLRVLFKREKFS